MLYIIIFIYINIPMDNSEKLKYDNFINVHASDKEKIGEEIKEQLNLKPYTSLDPNNPPELTLPLLAFTTTSIYSDLLDGLSKALERVNSGEIQLENIQLTGGSNQKQTVKKNDASLSQVNDQSNQLNQQVKDTASVVNKQLNEHYNRLSAEGNKMLQFVLKKWMYVSEVFVNKLINNVLKYTNDGIVDKPWNELLPEFNEKIVILAATLNELSTNPATKEAIKEIAEALSISAIELIDAIEPSVMQVVNRSIAMSEEIGDKSARGAMNTAISFAQALIAEVPYIGGIIDFVIAIGKAFNTVASIFRIYTERSGNISVEAAQGVKNEVDTVERAKTRITNAVESAKDKIQQAQNMEKNTLANAQNVANVTNVAAPSGTIPAVPLNVTNKAQKGGRRISKSIKNFLTCEPKRPFTLKKNKHYNRKTRKSL